MPEQENNIFDWISRVPNDEILDLLDLLRPLFENLRLKLKPVKKFQQP